MRSLVLLGVLVLTSGYSLSGCRHESTSGPVKADTYRCPMHPSFTKQGPGTCGLCAMALVRQDPPDLRDSSTVVLDPSTAERAGFRTETVGRRSGHHGLRLTGRVISDLYLGASLAEYQSLRAMPENNPQAALPDSPATADLRARLQTARVRLQQIGVDDDTILEKPLGALTSRDPATYAWVYADVFADDFRRVRAGQGATIALANGEDVARAVVVCLDRAFDKDTHAGRARLLIPEPPARLKPEMLVTVRLEIPLDARIQIPTEAVIYMGNRAVVFVQEQPGRYAARPVVLGDESGGRVDIVKGLSEGETLVVGPSFLLASELKVKGAAVP